MKIWLIEDEEKLMRALARTKHVEMFRTIADQELQDRMRRENSAAITQKFTETLEAIHKNKPSKDLVNWEYLRVHNPKRYLREKRKREKELIKARMAKEIA